MEHLTNQNHREPELSEKTKNDLGAFYEALLIPIYVYRDDKCILAVPSAADRYLPPSSCLDPALQRGCCLQYMAENSSAFYAHLPLQEERLSLLMGPVFQLSLTRQDLHPLALAYQVRSSQQEDFGIFLRNIPQHSPGEFVGILSMMNHFLNPGTQLDPDLYLDDVRDDALPPDSIRNIYQDTDSMDFNDSLEFETVILDIVEHGQTGRLRDLQSGFFAFHPGTVANSALRNSKNLLIALITLVTRAGIRGGIEPQLAFTLSDRYIRKVEAASAQQELSALQFDALLCFTTQVEKGLLDHTANADMNKILTYIRNHTNSPLTVSAVADIFGYNPGYLSGRFKKELGFGLSEFIYRTRLEEARQLLLYTNKSLLEISQYLCFADQSHFQKKFKKQYGLSPLAYRRANQSSSFAQP